MSQSCNSITIPVIFSSFATMSSKKRYSEPSISIFKKIFLLSVLFNISKNVQFISLEVPNPTNFLICLCFPLKNFLYENSFQIQRYRKNVGKYIYHHDHDIRFDQKDHRVITYLWYLNTVEEGGQTELWKTIKIKPEEGKLLLFPASWTFPHSGLMPESNDKYIITGWLYENREKG